MERQIILNRIKTPDGTILISRHRHEYVEHLDKVTNTIFAVDGGNDYLRRVGNYSSDGKLLKKIKNILGLKVFNYEEMSLYSDDPFEVIRDNYARGGRGKDGDKPLTWVILSKMSNNWLEKAIEYNQYRFKDDKLISNELYRQELQYRKDNNIFVDDENNY